MRPLLTVPDLVANSGGPSRSVPALALALAERGLNPEIVTRRDRGGAHPALAPDPALVPTTAVPCPDGRARDLRVVPALRRALRERLATGHFALVHDAGIWMPANAVAAAAARSFRLPFIVSPRGMLEPWALGHHSWKKKLAWALFQRRDLAGAATLHATSAQEAENLRQAGLLNPIAVIPNGVETPPTSATTPTTSARIALFLSRLHPKKGLLDLVGAWAAVRPAGWRVRIVGPDENGHRRVVEEAIRSAGIGETFEFSGSAEGSAKWEEYRRASLFVLPTQSENFGIVIAEALACGLPVLTTRGTPWQEISENAAGWWIHPTPAALTEALRDATARSSVELAAMGARGRDLIASRYSWSRAAEAMEILYAWVLGRGERPAFVV